MDVTTPQNPGENGTGAPLGKYGGQLICVRYRHSPKKHKRYKTVELIVEEKDWMPDTRIPAHKRVYLRIGYGETELRELITQAGGYRNPDRKAGHLDYRSVRGPGLEKETDHRPGLLWVIARYANERGTYDKQLYSSANCWQYCQSRLIVFMWQSGWNE